MERLAPPHEVVPLLDIDWPDWWHYHGYDMVLEELSPDKEYLKISSNSAQLLIKRHFNNKDWYVDRQLIHRQSYQRFEGSIVMNDDQIRAAFGLDDTYSETSEELIRLYGGTVAVQGLFIRYRDFLNIPNPGAGNDGDQNISIKLDGQIKGAVKQILDLRVNVKLWNSLRR